MIDLYFSATPNGLKLRLFLEEAAIEYRLVPVRLSKGEQHREGFLAISPNNKIPAIVDHAPADGGTPLSMFESGAIMLYLADKCGRLLPATGRARYEVVQWLFWQTSGLGPMGGQAGHFRAHAAEQVPYAIDRYTREIHRLYGVLEKRLAGREYVVDAFSIADIACYPWVFPYRGLGQDLAAFPHLRRWYDAISARPATLRVYAGVTDPYDSPPAFSADERKALFGHAAPG
ncbi:MAG: glutathione S-transferase C-terminal domain-containing protein [Rudaea sp.]